MTELKLENVSYSYKNSEHQALSNVYCKFSGGSVTSIIGPSGSGKTTLLSIMAGLDKPLSGQVLIDGESLSTLDLDKYRRERVSMIFQAFNLFPLLTALENVCFPMEINGIAKKEAKIRGTKILESVGINSEKHKRYPSNLSGGEQQRVAIARALSSGARLLLADEPTGSLDSTNGEAVISILRRLAHEEGYCVVVVTHNMKVAETSDVIYHMSDGAVIQQKA